MIIKQSFIIVVVVVIITFIVIVVIIYLGDNAHVGTFDVVLIVLMALIACCICTLIY